LRGQPPGTIYRLTPEQLGSYYSNYLSLHYVQILDLTDLAARLGKGPEVIIIGIEPKAIEVSLDLSPEIAGVLPRVLEDC